MVSPTFFSILHFRLWSHEHLFQLTRILISASFPSTLLATNDVIDVCHEDMTSNLFHSHRQMMYAPEVMSREESIHWFNQQATRHLSTKMPQFSLSLSDVYICKRLKNLFCLFPLCTWCIHMQITETPCLVLFFSVCNSSRKRDHCSLKVTTQQMCNLYVNCNISDSI